MSTSPFLGRSVGPGSASVSSPLASGPHQACDADTSSTAVDATCTVRPQEAPRISTEAHLMGTRAGLAPRGHLRAKSDAKERPTLRRRPSCVPRGSHAMRSEQRLSAECPPPPPFPLPARGKPRKGRCSTAAGPRGASTDAGKQAVRRGGGEVKRETRSRAERGARAPVAGPLMRGRGRARPRFFLLEGDDIHKRCRRGTLRG
eukprot:scaffold1535_cov382-Prasinococcus_capsulatus_cf.AAC.47